VEMSSIRHQVMAQQRWWIRDADKAVSFCRGRLEIAAMLYRWWFYQKATL